MTELDLFETHKVGSMCVIHHINNNNKKMKTIGSFDRHRKRILNSQHPFLMKTLVYIVGVEEKYHSLVKAAHL